MKTALIAICCNEQNIAEWCRYHLKLGFDAIYVALNNCSPEYVQYCNSLDVDGVLFCEFNPPDCDPGLRLGAQFKFYNAWLTHFTDVCDAAAFLDVDEYLWLGGQTVPEFLRSRMEQPVLAFNWKYFSSKDDVAEPSDSLLKRFTWRQKGFNQHVKPLVNLKRIRELGLRQHLFFVNPHMVGHPASQIPTFSPDGLAVYGPYNQNPGDVDCFVAHFYSRTTDEFAKKIARGRPDCARTSNAQYFNCAEHMWQERARCNLPEVRDTRLRDFAEDAP